NSTTRFSNRVENYIRYRPRYPEEVIRILEKEFGLTDESVIADIGSGTGISSELFLHNGYVVFAVEPNAEMRHAAERQFGSDPRFFSIAGTAEESTLEPASVHFVVAGQACHWFDQPTPGDSAAGERLIPLSIVALPDPLKGFVIQFRLVSGLLLSYLGIVEHCARSAK
ncbi:MAG: methyltransferase domain-containing protein, partial [Bacteroidota bacterium]